MDALPNVMLFPGAAVAERPPNETSNISLPMDTTEGYMRRSLSTMAAHGGDAVHFEVPGLTHLSQIGRGASSTVYRAHDDQLNRWVAVKVLSADDPADPARRRFDREREITANLGKHPHIVQVLGTGFTSNRLPYVAMELYEQGSVADRLRATGAFPVPEVIDIGVKIADAVEAAHRAGVLHRDIKPQNILLSEYGPALADFGIARTQANLEWSQSLDQLTPWHAAPEILLGEPPTAQADIYSLGSTLYTMLAGRPPFAGPSDESILRYQVRVSQDPVPPLARADVPPGLTAVIVTALAKKPEDRYQSAASLRGALAGLVHDAEALVDPPTVSSTRQALVGGPEPALFAHEPAVDDSTRDRRKGAPSTLGPSPIEQDFSGVAPVEDPGPRALVPEARPPFDEALTTARGGTVRDASEPAQPEPARPRRRLWLLGAAAAVIIAGLAVTLLVRSHQNSGGSAFTLTDAPSNLTATISPAGSSVNLGWSDNTEGTAEYTVWQIGSGPKKIYPLRIKGATSYNDLRIVPGQGYCFVVAAYLDNPPGDLAPGCICINGARLKTAPVVGFPIHQCTSG